MLLFKNKWIVHKHIYLQFPPNLCNSLKKEKYFIICRKIVTYFNVKIFIFQSTTPVFGYVYTDNI